MFGCSQRYNNTAVNSFFPVLRLWSFLSVYLPFDPETYLAALNFDIKNVKLSYERQFVVQHSTGKMFLY